jgi:hypothetical protein
MKQHASHQPHPAFGTVRRLVKKTTTSGVPYYVMEIAEMPRIEDERLEAVVYVYPTELAAEDGSRSGGSGFLVGVASMKDSDNFVHLYVVTNRHVILADEMTAPVVRLNMRNGNMDVRPSIREQWRLHPEGHDLAVLPFGLVRQPFQYRWFSLTEIVTTKLAEHHGIGPGDEVCMIGRLVCHEGKVKNTPAVRCGHISMSPGEPVQQFSHKTMFVVDLLCDRGFSGSPVMVILPKGSRRPPNSSRPSWAENPFEERFLLGVMSGHFADTQHVANWNAPQPDTPTDPPLVVRANLGSAVVVPGWRLRTFLESDHFQEERRERETNIPDPCSGVLD